jgi:hypothetical protein
MAWILGSVLHIDLIEEKEQEQEQEEEQPP